MQHFIKTIILRHRRENLKKCSLRGLENRPDMQFFTYPTAKLPDLKGYVLLSLDAPVLTEDDKDFGIFLLDATWRWADKMDQFVQQHAIIEKRSLPGHFKTAYPRRQLDCPDPDAGLASIEALYIAYHILGRESQNLLDHYHWKDQFLSLNSNHLK